MTKYKVTYKQRFNGEVLTESYIRSVRNKQELHDVREALLSDDHVFNVEFEKVVEEEEDGRQ